MLAISLIFSLFGTSGAPTALGAPEAASQPAQTVTVRVVRLTGFEQIRGNPAWIARDQQRLSGSVWQFNPDGTFAWSTTDVRTDLLPVRGTYTASGSQWSFAGHNSTAIGGSSAFIEITGNFDVSRSEMRMAVASGAGYGAVVNGQAFGSSASSAYQGVMAVAAQ
ncbi:hypothetical protein ABT403_15925 [Streptomyces sp. NPDC000075]|uniref:hypothetical protein n=1 Tax=Streptomyces TaxID=1883 RepID=UPI0031D2AFFB